MDAYFRPAKFPVLGFSIPVIQIVFPVNLRRELREKSLRHKGILPRNRLLNLRNCKIPCKIPCWQGICVETGAISTASPARSSVYPEIADETGPDLQAAHDAAPVPARLATVSGTPGKTSQAGQDWPAYGGSKLATPYSPLDQITSQNVSRLEKVWTYRTGDMPSEQAKGKYSPENTSSSAPRRASSSR
jgi:hypothetical protein